MTEQLEYKLKLWIAGSAAVLVSSLLGVTLGWLIVLLVRTIKAI